MNRLFLVPIALAVMVGFNGCTTSKNTNVPVVHDTVDTSGLDGFFQDYLMYRSYKAMAVAMGDDGRYAMGYSLDYSSQNSANDRAIQQCINSNNTADYPVDAQCEIYAIGNAIIHALD